jgi:iron complex transport system substrate-binding protein
MRICSLLPSATEIAFALGLGDDIVGVTHECDYPPEARKRRVVVRSAVEPDKNTSREIDDLVRERLGAKKGIYTIDLASFREARPDFILTQELCEVCALDYREVAAAAESLAHKPKIISLAPTTLADVLHDIETVGEAAGRKPEAASLVSQLKRRIERVREQASGSDTRPRVACIEWLEPIYNAGHWVPEMVELAGGADGLAKKGERSKEISWDEVRAFAPEVVVLMPCGFDLARSAMEAFLLHRLDGWSGLPAVKSGRVYAVDGSAYFNRPGPRLIDGLEILAAIIHPEIFTETLPAEAMRQIGMQ